MEQSIVRGGIYLVQLGEGVGSEQSGSRPFLVLQNDKGNEHSFTYTGVTLSTELKSLYLPTHIVAADSNCLEYTSVVLVEQMRSLSRKRFVSYLGKLDTNTLNEVEVAVSIQLGLKNVRDTDKVTFMKRLTKINPFLNVFLCGKCRRVLYKVKGLSIYGIHESTEALDFCALCHTAKGRKYKIVGGVLGNGKICAIGRRTASESVQSAKIALWIAIKREPATRLSQIFIRYSKTHTAILAVMWRLRQ